MKINEELIKAKYQEMKRLGISEDFLNEEAFGELKIFINKKPELLLFSFTIDKSENVYIGSENLNSTQIS